MLKVEAKRFTLRRTNERRREINIWFHRLFLLSTPCGSRMGFSSTTPMIITLLTTIRTSRFCRGGLSPLIILLVSIASVRADLFVTDSNGVSRYDTTTNTVTTDFIPLNDATGLTFGSDGLLYVATTNPERLRVAFADWNVTVVPWALNR
jgi:hypothetical protein